MVIILINKGSIVEMFFLLDFKKQLNDFTKLTIKNPVIIVIRIENLRSGIESIIKRLIKPSVNTRVPSNTCQNKYKKECGRVQYLMNKTTRPITILKMRGNRWGRRLEVRVILM